MLIPHEVIPAHTLMPIYRANFNAAEQLIVICGFYLRGIGRCPVYNTGWGGNRLLLFLYFPEPVACNLDVILVVRVEMTTPHR